MEYARVCSLPSGLGCLMETNCPGVKRNSSMPSTVSLEMLGLRRQQNGLGQPGSKHLPLDGWALLGLSFHDLIYVDAPRS